MVRTLWSVLVEVMAPREASNAREYPQRQEKPVQMEGFVSARDMQIFSGSSEEEDSAGILQNRPRSPLSYVLSMAVKLMRSNMWTG
jgi:hypothetical protein